MINIINELLLCLSSTIASLENDLNILKTTNISSDLLKYKSDEIMRYKKQLKYWNEYKSNIVA